MVTGTCDQYSSVFFKKMVELITPDNAMPKLLVSDKALCVN